MIDRIEAPTANTAVFHLKFATAAFLPALADPYAFIYKRTSSTATRTGSKPDHGFGAFRNLKEYQMGQWISAANPDYYGPVMPIVSLIGIFVNKQAVRVERSRPTAGDRVPWLPAGNAR